MPVIRDLPRITVLINTYRRPRELQYCLNALLDYLVYPRERLTWIIADDCSGGRYPYFLREMEHYKALNLQIVSTPTNSGWSASANNGLGYVKTPYVYHTDDDFILNRTLDLRIPAALLEKEAHIGMVRFAALASNERYTYQQYETDVSEWLNIHMNGSGATLAGKLAYFILDPLSPSLYLYSQTPQLTRMIWYDTYGYFPLGLKLGEAEEKQAHRVKDILRARPDAPQIATLPDWVNMHFDIVHEFSWQHTEQDKRRVTA